jgi:hypothetical protein
VVSHKEDRCGEESGREEKEVENLVEERTKVKSRGKIERDIAKRMEKQNRYVRRFPGFAHLTV